MRFAVLVAVILTAVPAAASEPGQPLDCSDWVFVESGLSCTAYISPSEMDDSSVFVKSGTSAVTDNAGALLSLRTTLLDFASSDDFKRFRTELIRLTASGEEVLAYIEGRNSPNNVRDHVRPTQGSCAYNTECHALGDQGEERILIFDATNGRLLIPLRSFCTKQDPYSGGGCPNPYGGGWWIAALSGFTTTFEMLQTYTPEAGPISFRVPYLPEGFPAADYFDTYYGDLATVGDWSQALPLQCGYPATAPSVGDHLTALDPLPVPAPGHGRYYVTAVTHQGQRRFGRKSSGGVLSGRDAALLPACMESE